MSVKIARGKRSIMVWLAVAAGVLLLAGANAHLAYVAITTQPDCVAHAREGAGAAAKSACQSE
jgi:hypothetical protein